MLLKYEKLIVLIINRSAARAIQQVFRLIGPERSSSGGLLEPTKLPDDSRHIFKHEVHCERGPTFPFSAAHLLARLSNPAQAAGDLY